MNPDAIALIGASFILWVTLLVLYRSLGKLEGTVTAEVKRLDQRISTLEKHVDQRFDALEKHFDHRFDGLERRLDELLKAKVLTP